MISLLPVLDDMKRASTEFNKSKESGLTEGFSLIKNKFSEILKNEGLVTIDVINGDDFDSEIHEAITQIPTESKKMKGKVVDVVESGYKLGEKILRYPKVVVGK
jgi:molecular chaperone GrpE